VEIAAGTFNTGDVLDGGLSNASRNTLHSPTGGAVARAGSSTYQLFPAQRPPETASSSRTWLLPPSADINNGAVSLTFNGRSTAVFTAIVQDGKGNDTVDFSGVAEKYWLRVQRRQRHLLGVSVRQFFAFTTGR